MLNDLAEKNRFSSTYNEGEPGFTGEHCWVWAMHVPAEPVKKTFRPSLTMSSTDCCSSDKAILGERDIPFIAFVTAVLFASNVVSEATSAATADALLLAG